LKFLLAAISSCLLRDAELLDIITNYSCSVFSYVIISYTLFTKGVIHLRENRISAPLSNIATIFYHQLFPNNILKLYLVAHQYHSITKPNSFFT